MSIHSTKEWRQYILTRGVFGNALKFSHLEVCKSPTVTHKDFRTYRQSIPQELRIGRVANPPTHTKRKGN